MIFSTAPVVCLNWALQYFLIWTTLYFLTQPTQYKNEASFDLTEDSQNLFPLLGAAETNNYRFDWRQMARWFSEMGNDQTRWCYKVIGAAGI